MPEVTTQLKTALADRYVIEREVGAVGTRGTFSLGNRRLIFEGAFLSNQNHANFDVHAATGGFVMIKSHGSPTELVVVLNWFEELRERAGK